MVAQAPLVHLRQHLLVLVAVVVVGMAAVTQPQLLAMLV
jgi:hypothetical protein